MNMSADPRTDCENPVFWRGGVVDCGRCPPCVVRKERRGEGKTREERIEPAAGEPAPNLGWNGPHGTIWSPRGTPHHGLCGCMECRALKRTHPVTVIPFAVLDPATRAKGEPMMVIEYGGVRIEIAHTLLRIVTGAIRAEAMKSHYGESLHVLTQALDEVERRMWLSYEAKR